MPALPARGRIGAVPDPDLLARFAAVPAPEDEPSPAEPAEPPFDPYAWADAYDAAAAERTPALAVSPE